MCIEWKVVRSAEMKRERIDKVIREYLQHFVDLVGGWQWWSRIKKYGNIPMSTWSMASETTASAMQGNTISKISQEILWEYWGNQGLWVGYRFHCALGNFESFISVADSDTR